MFKVCLETSLLTTDMVKRENDIGSGPPLKYIGGWRYTDFKIKLEFIFY